MDIKTIVTRLKKPIDKTLLRSKILKGNKIYFISWYHTCQLLDDRAGLWDWSITNITVTHERIVICGSLTIYGSDNRSLSMSATGTELLNVNVYGDPSSNAEAMAFKRAAAKFGLARYLYDKELRNIYTDYSENEVSSNTLQLIESKPNTWSVDSGLSFSDWKSQLSGSN